MEKIPCKSLRRKPTCTGNRFRENTHQTENTYLGVEHNIFPLPIMSSMSSIMYTARSRLHVTITTPPRIRVGKLGKFQANQ